MPQLSDAAGALQRYMWLMDLADGLDAPLDNAANAQLFPLPQARALRPRAAYLLQSACQRACCTWIKC